MAQARRIIEAWRVEYNSRRPHRSLDRKPPNAVYFKSLPLAAAA
jgi:transposase InsO family protein